MSDPLELSSESCPVIEAYKAGGAAPCWSRTRPKDLERVAELEALLEESKRRG